MRSEALIARLPLMDTMSSSLSHATQYFETMPQVEVAFSKYLE